MKSHWNGKSKDFHRFDENLWLQVWQFADGFRLMSLGMCIWIKPHFVLPSREASAFLCFLCFQDIKAPISKQKIQEANWMAMRYYQLLVINKSWMEQNTVADLQQPPAWSESSFRCCMHKQRLRGPLPGCKHSQDKTQTFLLEGLFTKWALITDMPLTLSCICFWGWMTLKPVTRAWVQIFVVFSSLFYMCGGGKLQPEIEGPVFWLVLCCSPA